MNSNEILLNNMIPYNPAGLPCLPKAGCMAGVTENQTGVNDNDLHIFINKDMKSFLTRNDFIPFGVKEQRFFKGKRVFVTGHTGFKGAWLCHILLGLGADVTGFALEPPTVPSLFELSGLGKRMRSVTGDVRNFPSLYAAFQDAHPEIVLHLAAQPIVRDSYQMPRETYETNVMGTVNVLECIRLSGGVRSVLNVTTDKVYENKEWQWGYRENEPLDGYDPYSNSKSCSELVTHCYKNSYFRESGIAVSTARAGNVIGGGDFANDRIIPDCICAAIRKEPIRVRNPHATRPYQHVLEPLFAYLLIAQKQYGNPQYADWYNIGPDERDCVNTGTLVDLFCQKWGEGLIWETYASAGPHEANFLKLDCSKIKNVFQWTPKWHIDYAVEKTCEWTKQWIHGENVAHIMARQITDYLSCMDGGQ